MPDTAAPIPACRTLNIGIYGCTHAGKSRFLWHLLDGWHEQRRVLQASERCSAFVRAAGAVFRDKQKGPHTVASLEGITATVSRDADRPPWHLILRDIRGEFLSKSIDTLDAPKPAGHIPDQVSQCNAFLFFFDPTSADEPEQLDKHYQTELERAEQFIRFVLSSRENENLPVVFVETRLDLWEADPQLRVRAKKWFKDVHQLLELAYRAKLKRHFPQDLVKSAKIAISISSVREHQEVEQVVERLDHLVGKVERFRAEDQRKIWPWLLVVAMFLVGAAVLLAWQFSTDRDHSRAGSPGTGEAKRDPWSPDEVRRQLDQIGTSLQAHPTGNQLPTEPEAKQINDALKWLTEAVRRLEEPSEEYAKYPPELQSQVRDTWHRACRLVQNKAEATQGLPLDKRLTVLSDYLQNVQAPGSQGDSLVTAQRTFWTMQRTATLDVLAATFRKHQGAGSDPITALHDVRRVLRVREQEVRNCRVYSAQAHANLLSELQTAGTFCENREKDRGHTAKLKVQSAKLTCPYGIIPVRRRLTFQPAIGQPTSLDLQVHLDSDKKSCRLQPPEGVELAVTLALGRPGTLQLAMFADKPQPWQTLHEFPLAADCPGSLAVLGMPFLRPRKPEDTADAANRGTIVQAHEWNGYDLRVAFSELPEAPSLFWDALDYQRSP